MMNLFNIKNIFFSILLSLSLLFSISLSAEESAVVVEDTTTSVEDPFGESLPSTPDAVPTLNTMTIGDGSLEELETLEVAVPDASSLEAYKLLSYKFTGTLIRSEKNRKAILATPSGDQYILTVGDFFSNENGVVKTIQLKNIIVLDQNGEEYIFSIGRKGKKKSELTESSVDTNKENKQNKEETPSESVSSNQSVNLETLNYKNENKKLLATVERLTKEIEKLNIIIKDQKTLIEKQRKEIIDQNVVISELREIKSILDNKLSNIEKENLKLSQIIDENQLNKKDLDLITQSTEENLLLGQQLKVIKEKNENLSSELISKEALIDSLESEKKALENSLSSIKQENENIKKEINALSLKIKDYEETLDILGKNDFVQKTKNLLGFGKNQEKIIEQLQKSNKTLSEQNIVLTDEINKASALNLELSNESQALLSQVESMKDFFAEHQVLKDEFSSITKQRNLLENELAQLKTKYKQAQELISSNKNLISDITNKIEDVDTEITTGQIITSSTSLNKGDRLIANTHVNMRGSSNLSAQVIKVIKKGEIVSFDSKSNGWFKVSTITQETGYIDPSFLDLVNKKTQETKQNKDKLDLSVTVTVNYTKRLIKSINVYEESTSKSDIIAKIPADNNIRLVSKSTNADGETMININFGGKFLGYIKEKDL